MEGRDGGQPYHNIHDLNLSKGIASIENLREDQKQSLAQELLDQTVQLRTGEVKLVYPPRNTQARQQLQRTMGDFKSRRDSSRLK